MQRRTLGVLSISLLSLAGCPSSDDTSATGLTLGTEDDIGDGDGDGDTAESESGTSESTTDDATDDLDTADDLDTTDETTDDTTTGDPPCMSDADCEGDPDGPVCNAGECVPCTPENDVCEVGFYCSGDNECVVGCAIDDDCPNDLVCGADNTCTGCVMDGNCALGSICVEGECVPGCNDQQPCQDGFSCCNGDCIDPLNDFEFCGGCDADPCPDFPNAADFCELGTCAMGECDEGWNDCNGIQDDGCETQAQCQCQPGTTISCYSGFPANTEGVGLCHAGERTCNAQGTGYGPCVGEVLPAIEICGSGQDENCNGQTDENPDIDQDGWGACDNDCCDQVSPECATPNLVNPGAFEVANNTVDDDCDGMIDNPLALCDGGLASNSANAQDYARAIDICQFTTENPALSQKKWGYITGNFALANGAGSPSANSRSIRPQFGNNNPPKAGQRMAVLSTGHAAATGQTNPNFAAFQTGVNTNTSSAAPADWLAANGGSFPNAPGCTISGSTTAYNPVLLRMRIRVPTNANSFSTKMWFASAEYPEYVCTSFNDFFVTLVTSASPNNPADKNIAIYTNNNQSWPVGVNLAKAANGLFRQCQNGQISQCGAVSNYNGCQATTELIGTGFDTNASACGHFGYTGGSTGWLTMSGNVTPGETMELRFVIWDTADQSWDSLVLLDDFRWSVQAAQPGVTPG